MDNWKMPTAELGDWVLFYAHEHAEPAVGLVQKVGSGSLILWVLAPGYGGVEKQSVHHKDDPRLPNYPEWKVYGTWAHRPENPRVSILSEKVALLEKKVQELVHSKAK